MSGLSSLFNRATFGTRCKTCLNLAVSRIKLLHNRRDLQRKHMRKEIAQYLQTGQEAIAWIKVEQVYCEQNISSAYEIIELFCEFLIARIPILEVQRDCPLELLEAVSSIIFASPRCLDVPELLQVRNLLNTKYGKDFISAAAELRPDSCVNRVVIEKLSVGAPPVDKKLIVLKEIAREYNLAWDSSSTEKEFSKMHEDLLDGSIPIPSEVLNIKSSSDVSSTKDGHHERLKLPHPVPVAPTYNNPAFKRDSSLPNRKNALPSERDAARGEPEAKHQSSDAMDRAHEALAVAEHALAVAYAAAELCKHKLCTKAGM